MTVQEINFTSGPPPQSLDRTAGTPGESAYQIWLDQGNIGTEADFLAWLKGAKGDQGNAGPTGPSAYDVAVAQGFQGSVQDWLASLKGSPGTNAVYGVDDLPTALPVWARENADKSWPARASLTNNPNRTVIWDGPDNPPSDAIVSVDRWLRPQVV